MNLTDIATPPLLDLSAWWGGVGVVSVLYFFGALVLSAGRLRVVGADLHALRVACGFSVVPPLVLIAGQVHGLVAGFSWSLPAVGGVVWFALSAFRAIRTPANESGTETTGIPPGFAGRAGWVILAGLLLVLLGPAFAPPINYDVLEYHLGVTAWYFETGRITPVPHMFYSAQPLAAEMLYFLSAASEGSARGAASGVTQWLLIAFVAFLALRSLARLRTPAPLTPWLALLLLSHPVFVSLEVDRMTDLAACVPLGGAFLLRLHASREGENTDARSDSAGFGSMRFFGLMGALAGGAAQVKWTNLGTCVPIVLALAAAPLPGRSVPLFSSRLPIGLASFAAGFGVVMLPWAVWLRHHAGNPFAPFMAGVFPTEAWGARRLEFLLSTHGPLSPASMAYWTNLYSRLASFTLGPPLVAAWAILCGLTLAARKRNSESVPEAAPQAAPAAASASLPEAALLAALAVGALLWGRLGHAQDRFLAPAVFASVILFGAAAGRMPGAFPQAGRAVRMAVALAILAAAPYLLLQTRLLAAVPYLPHATGRISANEFLRAGMGATVGLFEEANELPHGSRVLCFGEARRFYFRRPVTMASVFDRHPVVALLEGCGSAEDLKWRIADAGFTHILFNDFETGRLLSFHPPPVVERDPAFGLLRAAGSQTWFDIASRYRGFLEFGIDEAEPERRAVLGEFLSRVRAAAPGRPMAVVALRDL